MSAASDRAARYAEVVARNHARVAAMRDRRTMALGLDEDLTLVGETMPARVAKATAQITVEEPEQGQLF